MNPSNSAGKLKFGLNVKPSTKRPVLGLGTKTPLASGAGPISFGLVRKKTIASELEDDDDQEHQRDSIVNANAELSKVQSQKYSLAEKQKTEALEEDASIFDYDGFHEAKKQVEIERKRVKEGLGESNGAVKKARYMESLLQTAAKRKIEQERIEERKVQKEREKEGDLYGDKEMFVTEAYLKKQEELKKLEEEERRREAMEGNHAQDMTGFYRNILEEREKQAIIVTGVSSVINPSNRPKDESQLDVVEQEQIASAIQAGRVQVNDSNEIVDKRQLLTGGLNITVKAKASLEKKKQMEEEEQKEREKRAEFEAERERQRLERERLLKKKQQEQRHAQLVRQQQKEVQKQSEIASKQKQEQLASLAKSQLSGEVISDAKARYLARKAQAAQAQNQDDKST